ncbi:hypothetical protein BCR35DRAFT_332554 [Leucosporidium creatinivorum]|uniref:Uncharacterized protein n=1 Tax=Leucosporidium creatinivorum TaxID=106004 RepID=A0A1Y2F1B3_9BASI|nr:hypothetical protein BCR35DRAFT_332554 [Leucosporidium creatinivorum]
MSEEGSLSAQGLCEAISKRSRGDAPASEDAYRRDFSKTAFHSFGSASMSAFRKLTNSPLEQTHVLAMAFELNESRSEGDGILHRYKVKSSATLPDVYVEQQHCRQTRWDIYTKGSVNYFSGDPSSVRYDENWVTTLGSDLKVGAPSPSLLCFSGSGEKPFGVLGGFVKGWRRAEIHA